MKASHILLIILLVIAIFAGMQMIQEPTAGEQLDNAATDITNGVEDAAENFDRDDTVGERIEDAGDRLGDNIEDATE